jgi:16S rRNA (cytidine1402-2'-O)-methyltransferase
MAGVLYVVATPIGNLGDITLRALETLKTVDLIAAEDTRHTKKLLQHYGIETPLVSFHQHSGAGRIEQLVRRLQQGESIALVTDAGTPGISDPGGALVEAAHRAGVRVVPIPGASAVQQRCCQLQDCPRIGFGSRAFPRARRARADAFSNRCVRRTRLWCFSSPRTACSRRCRAAYDALGDCTVVVGRELTKQFEEVFRGTLSEAIAHWQATPPRGEFVIVLAYG